RCCQSRQRLSHALGLPRLRAQPNSSAHRCQLQIAARPLPAYAAFPQTRQGTLQQQSPSESSRFSSTLVLDALKAYTPCPATVAPCSRVIISFSFKQSQPEELMTYRITIAHRPVLSGHWFPPFS